MKVTSLLEKLDQRYEEKSHHKFVIFGDFSGEIIDKDEKIVIDFHDEKEMICRLNDLWRTLNEELEEVKL